MNGDTCVSEERCGIAEAVDHGCQWPRLRCGCDTTHARNGCRVSLWETRLIWARRKSDDELVLLPDGAVDEWRHYANTELECPIYGCDDPWLTTVARTVARQGFRHRAGAGSHRPESLFHLQSKATPTRWLESHYPTSTVTVEPENHTGIAHTADVMVVASDGVHRMAFEIQYARLSLERWVERHERFLADGVVDVWMFGHVGAQASGVRDGGDVRLTATHRAVVEAGLPLMWFNPFDSSITMFEEWWTTPEKTYVLNWMISRQDYPQLTVKCWVNYAVSSNSVNPSRSEAPLLRAHDANSPLGRHASLRR